MTKQTDTHKKKLFQAQKGDDGKLLLWNTFPSFFIDKIKKMFVHTCVHNGFRMEFVCVCVFGK